MKSVDIVFIHHIGPGTRRLAGYISLFAELEADRYNQLSV